MSPLCEILRTNFHFPFVLLLFSLSEQVLATFVWPNYYCEGLGSLKMEDMAVPRPVLLGQVNTTVYKVTLATDTVMFGSRI